MFLFFMSQKADIKGYKFVLITKMFKNPIFSSEGYRNYNIYIKLKPKALDIILIKSYM